MTNAANNAANTILPIKIRGGTWRSGEMSPPLNYNPANNTVTFRNVQDAFDGNTGPQDLKTVLLKANIRAPGYIFVLPLQDGGPQLELKIPISSEGMVEEVTTGCNALAHGLVNIGA